MANEIWHSYQDGSTLYALIWRKTDDQIYDVAAGSNTFEAYADANIGNYDLPMTAAGTTGDYYSVDFPAGIATGVYRVTVMLQAGASPHVDNDITIAQGEIYWDGTAEVDLYTISETDLAAIITHLTDIKGTGFVKDTDSLVDLAHTGADGDTLETLSDQLDDIKTDTETIIALESKTLNVYPTGSQTTITGGSALGVPDDEKEIR